MSAINISNLSFAYNDVVIFDDLNLILDTSWKLGLIGRNGRGKTTLLKILNGDLEHEGAITAKVDFKYFPFVVGDETKSAREVAAGYLSGEDIWKFEKEASLLGLNNQHLMRAFDSLSKGEQTKIMLALLFAQENCFYLIDEPTNHLDAETRRMIANYLRQKQGFILVSHDRGLLDRCVDHVLSINRQNIDLQKGNFTTWWQNKTAQDNLERAQNEHLQKDIRRLAAATRRSRGWADKIEKTKIGAYDKGYIGHQAARMMKRAKATADRQARAVEEKKKLLQNVDEADDLRLNVLPNRSGKLIEVDGLVVEYDGRRVVDGAKFDLQDGERLLLRGANGSGKSTILKVLLGQMDNYSGRVSVANNLRVSYIPQSVADLSGSLRDFEQKYSLDGANFRAILYKLGLSRELFDKSLEGYSAGQKKKVLLAKSFCEPAQMYIWDEPLNYIDVISRMQIEEAILRSTATMIFVEHDAEFARKVATKVIEL